MNKRDIDGPKPPPFLGSNNYLSACLMSYFQTANLGATKIVFQKKIYRKDLTIFQFKYKVSSMHVLYFTENVLLLRLQCNSRLRLSCSKRALQPELRLVHEWISKITRIHPLQTHVIWKATCNVEGNM